MCGSSEEQKSTYDEQQNFYKMLTKQYSDIFGQQQGIVSALTKEYLPILQAGPTQAGFSDAYDQSLRTQNTESVATNYANAQKATAQILAARGGGNTLLPSSVDANLLAQNANQAAAARAAGEQNITMKNYEQGYQNWNTAASVLGSTASLINPTSYSGQATSAGNSAATSANNIAAAANSPWNAAFGALGSVAGAATGAYIMKH